MLRSLLFIGLAGAITLAPLALSEPKEQFEWTCGRAVVGPEPAREDRCVSVKDPSIVQYGGKWHLFTTIRSQKRTHQIEYANFDRWERANDADRRILNLTNGYFCAPQVFYFTPQQRWYLLHQISMPERKVVLQPAFSTSTNLFDPAAWSTSAPLFEQHPEPVTQWIDFWVICDSVMAHLFFTSFDGKLWRAETPRENFPRGWSRPEVVLQGDFFEANHTYALRDRGGYISLIEAQGVAGRRYYKAYRAASLSGKWEPLADTFDHPFAGSENVHFTGERWSDSFSHGELLRAGYDERLEIEWESLVFLIQGVADRDRLSRPYGEIPWRLGLLRRISR